MSREGGNGRGKRGLRTSNIWAPAGLQARRCDFVLSLLTPGDVSPVTRFLHILDKRYFCTYFPTSSGEVLSGKGLFL